MEYRLVGWEDVCFIDNVNFIVSQIQIHAQCSMLHVPCSMLHAPN